MFIFILELSHKKLKKIQIIMNCWYCCYNHAGVLIPFKPQLVPMRALHIGQGTRN